VITNSTKAGLFMIIKGVADKKKVAREKELACFPRHWVFEGG